MTQRKREKAAPKKARVTKTVAKSPQPRPRTTSTRKKKTQNEFVQYHRNVEKMKKEIREKDKLYKRIGPPQELYRHLINYFTIHPIDKAKDFFNNDDEASVEFVDQLIIPEPGLKKLLNKKKKIQDLTKHLVDNYSGDGDKIEKVCAAINFERVIYERNKRAWFTLRFNAPCAKRIDSIKKSLGKELDKLQNASATSDNPVQFTVLYQSDLQENISYIYLRIKFGGENKRCTFKVFAFRPDLPHLFVHGELIREPIEAVARALGFKVFENQRLSGTSLAAVIESCQRKIIPPDAEALKRKREEEERIRKEKDYMDNEESEVVGEKRRKIELMIDDNQPKGVNTCTVRFKQAMESDLADPQAEAKYLVSKFRTKVNKGSLDSYFVYLYRKGYVTLKYLQPYYAMKNTQTNSLIIT